MDERAQQRRREREGQLLGREQRDGALHQQEGHVLSLERRGQKPLLHHRLPELAEERLRLGARHAAARGRRERRLLGLLLLLLALLGGEGVGLRLGSELLEHRAPHGVQLRVRAGGRLERRHERGQVAAAEQRAALQAHARQQRRHRGRREELPQLEAEEQRVGRPLVEGACQDGCEQRPRRGLQLDGGQLPQQLAQDDRAELLQEGLLAEAEEQLLDQTLHQRGARLGGERGEPGRADDGRAGEDAAEEHVALLGALHRALQLHRLLPERQHALNRDLLREGDKQLDERRAEALARTVARTGESADQSANGVGEVGACRAGCGGFRLRLLQHADEANRGRHTLVRFDRGEVPEEREERCAGLSLHAAAGAVDASAKEC